MESESLCSTCETKVRLPMSPEHEDRSGALADFAKLVLANAEQTDARLSNVEAHERTLPSEWWRYILSAIFAALLSWGILQSKLSVLENRALYNDQRIEELRDDNRTLRNQIRELEREIDRYRTPRGVGP